MLAYKVDDDHVIQSVIAILHFTKKKIHHKIQYVAKERDCDLKHLNHCSIVKMETHTVTVCSVNIALKFLAATQSQYHMSAMKNS